MAEPAQEPIQPSDKDNNHIEPHVCPINKNLGILNPEKPVFFEQDLKNLSNKREISSIPKADGKNGEFWVYPSERMFFQAMRRKNWDPKADDMQIVVPIHNAVNERVWREIISWEKGWGSEKCGGPKLIKFEGKSSKMSPKARMLKLLGYKPPFDRHDWKIDRCGKEVTYIIDFYSGKKEGELLSFYLDVRPKLDMNGGYMRIIRGFREFFQKKNDL
ncbi:hypothetical protein T552_00922 [Pneumocystis carinii B80]|uniref:Holocytochrome c-type synthase n=1 Tax=Pneumocystis carinii (strain B80) TaxID=1408658 RepID=A0A0W4ZMX2_PNEC8|nr:hypothetical protein T552_00922 [Pneumocystis carinii B80]KTW29715.1 hypothetical protein T552_00922 [Pneumocystis carinii B80]